MYNHARPFSTYMIWNELYRTDRTSYARTDQWDVDTYYSLLSKIKIVLSISFFLTEFSYIIY